MNERQQSLLKILTTEFIRTAQPVSSKFITDSGGFDLSSATIRNEMAELEREGYIFHPHTSAGRVPTEKGYQYFVENFIVDDNLSKKNQDSLSVAAREYRRFEHVAIKNLAKQMAALSDSAVFVAFANNDFYYTGLSNLFSQPEFFQHQLVYDLSNVIDHLDTAINKIFNKIDDSIDITVGSKNYFSRECSSVLTKYDTGDYQGIVGILGPMRMDYQNNFNLVKYSQELIIKLVG